MLGGDGKRLQWRVGPCGHDHGQIPCGQDEQRFTTACHLIRQVEEQPRFADDVHHARGPSAAVGSSPSNWLMSPRSCPATGTHTARDCQATDVRDSSDVSPHNTLPHHNTTEAIH